MARINIEDCWWSDLRRSKLAKLLGSEDLADAAAIRMWRLAQDFWKDGQRLVPLHIWEHFEYGQKCVESGLALVQDGSVYVRGSSQYLDWVREKREIAKANAAKGGKASAASRKKKNGSAQPLGGKGSENRSGTEPKTKQNGTDPNASGSYSYSSSGSFSDSGSDFEEKGLAEIVPIQSRKPTAFASDKVQPVIARYCELWKDRYKASAPVGGKVAGQFSNLVKDFGSEKAMGYIEAYLKMPDQWFITKRHDIPTLLNNLNAVAQFMESGRLITRKEVANLDSSVTTKNLLEKIDRGEA